MTESKIKNVMPVFDNGEHIGYLKVLNTNEDIETGTVNKIISVFADINHNISFETSFPYMEVLKKQFNNVFDFKDVKIERHFNDRGDHVMVNNYDRRIERQKIEGSYRDFFNLPKKGYIIMVCNDVTLNKRKNEVVNCNRCGGIMNIKSSVTRTTPFHPLKNSVQECIYLCKACMSSCNVNINIYANSRVDTAEKMYYPQSWTFPDYREVIEYESFSPQKYIDKKVELFDESSDKKLTMIVLSKDSKLFDVLHRYLESQDCHFAKVTEALRISDIYRQFARGQLYGISIDYKTGEILGHREGIMRSMKIEKSKK